MEHYSLLVPGASTEDKITVVAPYDNQAIATIDNGNDKNIEQALATASKLYKDRSSWLSLPQRIDILEKTWQIMTEQTEHLAREAAREGGKPFNDSLVEAKRAIDCVKICIETIRQDQGHVIPMQTTASSLGRIAFTQKEPIGVVVAVSAFNHPLNLIVHQVATAVAAGCPVIVKPASDTPLSCMRFVNILREAGLPESWCQAMVVKDNNMALNLVTDSRVAFVTFIGSARVGWMFREKIAPGTRCSLEHGGVAPAIVAEDADLDQAIPLLSKGGFYHAGQVCVSVQRIYAHESIAEQLAQGIADTGDSYKIGDPTLAETDVGPLIRHTEADRVQQWVDEAIAGGAKCISGGKRISDSCYACTVLYDPPSDAKVSTQEMFGPVICVYPYQDLQDAIDNANSLPVSFQSAIFTKNIDTAMNAYKQLDASAVMLNDHTAFRIDGMPFAGLKHSGYGVGGIPYTIEDMQVEKMLVINNNN